MYTNQTQNVLKMNRAAGVPIQYRNEARVHL